MAVTAEPLRVSPFIKTRKLFFKNCLSLFCRWSFLIAGIFYGMTRYEALSRKQKAIRDNFDRDRVERHARQAAEDKKRQEEELENLMKLF